MRSQLDDILDSLKRDYSNLAEICAQITNAVRHDPDATSWWPTLIGSRVKQRQLPLHVGRALLDAVETENTEKTMWMAPQRAQNPGMPAHVAAAQSSQTGTPVKLNANANATIVHQAPNSVTQPLRRALRTVDTEPFVEYTPRASLPTPDLDNHDASSERSSITPGTVVNHRYLLEHKLGHGAMGPVFEASDLGAVTSGVKQARVMIEVVAVDLYDHEIALEACKSAVQQNRRLQHPNIVKVFGIELADRQVSIVMEALSGRRLSDIIRVGRQAPLSFDEAWPLVLAIAHGLAAAHQLGIAHGNLNPCCVVVPNDNVPKIMGFELIRALPKGPENLALLDTMTLRAYSEAYVTNVTPSERPKTVDDLYSLGVIAYELLTGEHPFARHNYTHARTKNLQPTAIQHIPKRINRLLMDCLSFDAEQRPSNAQAFLQRCQTTGWVRWLQRLRLMPESV